LDGRVPGIRRRALIDLDAFRSQLTDEPWDARADAYGHGLALLAPAALEAGVREVVVSDERDARIARDAGFSPAAVRVDRRGTDADASAYGFVTGSPVMSLVGEVIALKQVGGGAGVSYGYTYRTPGPTKLALIALGYADGVPRAASNRAQVAVGDARFPLVGRIAMDQLVLDVGRANLELGADAVLWGDPSRNEPSALDWGVWTTRDPWTLTAGLAPRIRRVAR
jgi:alanine racemase